MLAKEKCRAAWSLAFGLVAAVGVAGWKQLEARHADQRAKAIIAKCESGPPLSKGYVHVCDPNDLVPEHPEELTGAFEEIMAARK